MSGWSVVRWTGVLGLAAVLVQLSAFIFFIGASAAAGLPSSINDANSILVYAKNTQFATTTGFLVLFIGLALFIGFIAGLRATAVGAAADYEWLATTTFGAGLVIIVIGYVNNGIGLAAAAIAVSSHADAAQIRLLLEISGVLGGPVWVVPAAFFLGSAGSLAAATKILPRWLAVVGWVGSVLTLITAFSAYTASDPFAFWSPNGIAVTTLTILPFWAWTVGASVVFLRRKG